MSRTQQWLERWDAALVGNYGTPPVVLASGHRSSRVLTRHHPPKWNYR